jgi:hypothetical protein
MSDNVLMVLIVVAGLALAIFMLRDRLTGFMVKMKGFTTKMQATPPGPRPEARASTVIRHTEQVGVGNTIDITGDAILEENRQAGIDQSIVVRSDPKIEGKRR